MAEKNIPNAEDLTATQQFPISWIKKERRKVEKILSTLSLEEQVRCVLNLPPNLQRELLILCENAVAVTQSLPAEEFYNLIIVRRQHGEGWPLQFPSANSGDLSIPQWSF